MAKGKSGFSYRTKDAVEGGGIDGASATISEIGFVDEFTYGGRQKDKPQAALRVEYAVEGFEKPWEQHYSVGPSEKYEVVGDGEGIRSLGKQAGLNKKSSCYAFFSNLEQAAEEAGLDLDDLLEEIDGEDGIRSVKPLEGRTVRLGNVKFLTVGGDTKDLPVICGFVDDEPPAKGGKGSKAAAKSSKKADDDDDVEEQTEKNVVGLLDATPKHTIKKSDLANLILAENRKDPNVKAMMQLAFKDAWVFSDDRPWESDKKKGVIRAKDDE